MEIGYPNYYNKTRLSRPLTREEEYELAIRVKEGDNNARESIINANARFVIKIAKKYQGFGLPLNDLISSGNIGLIKAIDRFNPDRGVKFINYAVHWIKCEIRNCLSEEARIIKPSSRRQEDLRKFKTIAEKTGLSLTEVIRNSETNEKRKRLNHLAYLSERPFSLDSYFSDEKDLTLYDIIDSRLPSPEEEVMEKDFYNVTRNQINTVLDELDEREQMVIKDYFGFENEGRGKTLNDIGKELGVTRERVRQIKEGILSYLQEKINRELIDSIHY